MKKKFLQKEKHLINCLFQFYSYQSIIFSVRQSSDCKALEELVSHQCGPRWNLESESRIVHTCRTWVEFSVGFYALTEGWSPDFLSSPLPFSPPLSVCVRGYIISHILYFFGNFVYSMRSFISIKRFSAVRKLCCYAVKQREIVNIQQRVKQLWTPSKQYRFLCPKWQTQAYAKFELNFNRIGAFKALP